MKIGIGLAIALALAGCDRQAPSDGSGAVDEASGSNTADDMIACRLGARWSRDCKLDRDGTILTIRHRDGGFRRFRLLADGHGLEAADGAERAVVTIVGGRQIEVAIGADRYRLPARIAAAR